MPYPYGMYNAPTVGNGLGGLPRRTSAGSGPLVWRAVGQPITVSESNYKGAARNNIAVDRGTNTFMLMENNAGDTALSATAYKVTTTGVLPIGTGSTTNATWIASCAIGNNKARRIIGAQGSFWLSTNGYAARISGGTITFGTATLSIPATTPIATGGTLGSVQGYVNGTIAASPEGRLFAYAAGTRAPSVEIDVNTGIAIMANGAAPNTVQGTFNSAFAGFGRYIAINDNTTTSQLDMYISSYDLSSYQLVSLARVGNAYIPTAGNGYAIIVDAIDENTISINTASSYASFNNPVIYDTSAVQCTYGSLYFANSSSVTALGSPMGGTPGNNYTYGDILFQFSQSGIGSSLVERRFLVGDLPSQRIVPTTTDKVICFSVGQNLAVVIAGTSMQAYYRS